MGAAAALGGIVTVVRVYVTWVEASSICFWDERKDAIATSRTIEENGRYFNEQSNREQAVSSRRARGGDGACLYIRRGQSAISKPR